LNPGGGGLFESVVCGGGDVKVGHVVAGHASCLLEENSAVAGLAIIAVAVAVEVLRCGAEGHLASRAVIVNPHQHATRLHLKGIKFFARYIHRVLLPQMNKY